MLQNQVKRAFSDVGLGLFFATLLTQAAGMLVGLGVGVLGALTGRMPSYSVILLVSYACLLLGYPVLRYFFRKAPYWHEPPRGAARLSLKEIFALVLMCLGAAYPIAMIMSFYGSFLERFGLQMENPLEDMMQSGELWVVLFLVIVVAPLIEEFVFRHLLYKKLICFGGKVYILFSAFLFGLYHMNLYQIHYAFMVGIILAAVTCHTGTVKYAIIIHALYNALNSIGLILGHFSVGPEAEIILLGIWGFILLGLMALGIVMLVRWLKKNYRKIGFGPPPVPA